MKSSLIMSQQMLIFNLCKKVVLEIFTLGSAWKSYSQQNPFLNKSKVFECHTCNIVLMTTKRFYRS